MKLSVKIIMLNKALFLFILNTNTWRKANLMSRVGIWKDAYKWDF